MKVSRFTYLWHLILVFTFFLCNVFAKESSDSLFNFLIRLEQNEKKINTVKADFVQTIFFEDTGEKQEIVGTVFLRKPDNIYITQRTPQEQRIYINAKTVTIYTPAEKQAIVDNWKNSFDGSFSPAAIVGFGSFWRELKKDNEISLGGYGENSIIIKVSSVKDKNFNAMIYISKISMNPKKAIINSQGLKLEIVFNNYFVNPKLSLDIFKFKYPDDVEVIKL